jgi:hypothetical protein
MLNIIGLAMLIVIAALLIWSGFRAWRVRSSFLKWGGAGLAAVLAVAVSYASVLTIAGMVKQHARRALVPDLKVEATPERLGAARRSSMAVVARAIQRPARSPVASTSARISRSLSSRSCPPI